MNERLRRNGQFSGCKLKEARLFRGLSMDELAKQVGISRQSVFGFEAGKVRPGYEHGIALASALRVPYSFFFRQEKFCAAPEFTYLRTAKPPKRERDAAERRLCIVAKLYAVLSEYVAFPCLSIPCLGAEDIEGAAMRTREALEITQGPVRNLQFHLEKAGVIVVGTSADTHSQRVYCNGNGLFAVAVSNGRKNLSDVYFDMAHELGHLVLHPAEEFGDEPLDGATFKRMESEANQFALAFLMPEEPFSKEISAHPTDLNFYKSVGAKWNVSVKAMVYRARMLGLISNNQLSYMMRKVREEKPAFSPYFLKANIFQGALELLFSNGTMTPSGFLECAAQSGTDLFPEDVEEILTLPRGTLTEKDNEQTGCVLLTLRR